MHVHFIGIAGTLMGSVAGLVQGVGHRVTGSDAQFYEPMASELARLGIPCTTGYRPENLHPRPDLVVVGNVCRADNPEARAAFEQGIETIHVAAAIQRFALEHTRPLVVTGTHGKTTTSALATHLLERVGRHPGYLIGGVPLGFEHSFRRARSVLPLTATSSAAPGASPSARPPFVIEGDEYDTAYFEKTPKFLHYRAEVAIITSVEHDHIDIYPTPEDYLKTFERFVMQLPPNGLLVAHAGDRTVAELASCARCEVAWFALADEALQVAAPVWTAALGQATREGTHFDVYAGGMAMGRWLLSAYGRHNVKNALAACIACISGFGVRAEQVRAALASFKGVKRRQEVLLESDVWVYDDFAHHPTAVRETLGALRMRHPQGRLVAVFEPRSATACRRLHQQAYRDAFESADVVYLAPVARQAIPEAERLDTVRLAADLGARGKSARAASSLDEIVEQLARDTQAGDVIVFLSNGDLSRHQQRLVSSLGCRTDASGPK